MKKFNFKKDEFVGTRSGENGFLVADEEFVTNGQVLLKKEFVEKNKDAKYISLNSYYAKDRAAGGERKPATLGGIFKEKLITAHEIDLKFIEEKEQYVVFEIENEYYDIEGKKTYIFASYYKRLKKIGNITFRATYNSPFSTIQIRLDGEVIGLIEPCHNH